MQRTSLRAAWSFTLGSLRFVVLRPGIMGLCTAQSAPLPDKAMTNRVELRSVTYQVQDHQPCSQTWAFIPSFSCFVFIARFCLTLLLGTNATFRNPGIPGLLRLPALATNPIVQQQTWLGAISQSIPRTSPASSLVPSLHSSCSTQHSSRNSAT